MQSLLPSDHLHHWSQLNAVTADRKAYLFYSYYLSTYIKNHPLHCLHLVGVEQHGNVGGFLKD